MSEPVTVTDTTTPKPRRRAAPPAPARPTLPATDAANSDQPLTLSSDALEGTKDRLTAMAWTDDGHIVRRRNDGVYEKIHAPEMDTAPEPESYEFYPDVDVLDRRVLDPNMARDIPILFTDEAPGQKAKYYKRWVDTAVASRLLTLTQVGGYRKAEWSMLKDKGEIGDRYEGEKQADPFVRRGEKGRYILLFMPYAKWLEIKTAQARLRIKHERTNLVEMAARQLGPQAADVLNSRDDHGRPGLIGTVKELPPMSLETFQGSGLPKDIAVGEGVNVLEE